MCLKKGEKYEYSCKDELPWEIWKYYVQINELYHSTEGEIVFEHCLTLT